jgi:hypothetical protein
MKMKNYFLVLLSLPLILSCRDPEPADCDGDGIPDSKEIYDGTQFDCDGDKKPDDCTPPWDLEEGEWTDCNGSCTNDLDEILDNETEDRNNNGIPDECEDGGIYGKAEPLGD